MKSALAASVVSPFGTTQGLASQVRVDEFNCRTTRGISGFRGADVLRRDELRRVAFITLTGFDTFETIRAIAGDDYETAVLEPTARAPLSRLDQRARHEDTSSLVI